MKCLFCGKEFEAKRRSARFDSVTCRVAYSRVSVTDSVTQPKDSVTDVTVKPLSVTDKVSVTTPTIDNGCNGVTVNGEYIPEDELNIFYRGSQGKAMLGTDEIYLTYYKVDPICYREYDRQAKLNNKKVTQL